MAFTPGKNIILLNSGFRERFKSYYICTLSCLFVVGPFRATQIWNEVIGHLKDNVELKKRRYMLKNYEGCFTGTDAVDVVLHYLLKDQDTFSNLSREKAVKVKIINKNENK